MCLICKWKKIFLLIILGWVFTCANSQDYRAVHGSSYGGSLGVANNPASIVHVPFKWDITPLAFQFKQSTNAFFVKNSSFLSPSKNAEAFLHNGQYKSFLLANQDIRLLNASIRLGDHSAIAFGAAGRSYISANTSSLLFHDSVGRIREFMGNNINNTPASAEARGHGWTELYGTYARTLMDNGNEILNAGITIKTNTGIAGGYITATDLKTTAGTVNNVPGYYLTSGLLQYGLSSNIDVLDSSTTYQLAKKEFFQRTFTSFGISLGAEFIVPSAVEGNGYDHDFKIGVSLLDLGANLFQYSGYSRTAVLNKNNVSDSLLDNFFDNLSDVKSLADSLDIISGSNSPLAGKFNIFQPARIVINADKNISGNFFINGELTIPFHKLMGKKQLVAKDMNFLHLAARFETKIWSLYFPASLNSRMHFWLGTAFRMGPLLLGVHNWASVVGKNKIQDGGAYIALTFRVGEKFRVTDEGGQIYSGKSLRQLKCPPSVQ